MFWVNVHFYYEASSTLLHLTESGQSISLYSSELFRLLLSSVISSQNTSDPVPLEAMHAHAITLLHHVSQMLLCALDHELFQAFSILFSSRHSVQNPLYFLSGNLLLSVDFDSDTSTSWRVFFSWLDVVKGFFFIMERILQSSTTVVLCGRPGLLMLLSSPVHCFYVF